jgi:dolichyl-phosphate beta-glucosyltransferase
MTGSIDLSIIIPAYNEAPAIRAGKLARVAEWLASWPGRSELLVVDDGSPDETAELARAYATLTLTIPHAGKAAAIVAGFRAAAGEVVLFTDMDQATPISEVPRLIEKFPAADIVIGSRGLVRPGAPAGRYVLSWGQVALRRVLLGLPFTDTQCGFKAARRSTALDVLDHLRVYCPQHLGTRQGPSVTSGFDVEFLFVAQRLGYRTVEVPVVWNYQESRRVRLFKDAWRGVGDLLQIVQTRAAGKYDRKDCD